VLQRYRSTTTPCRSFDMLTISNLTAAADQTCLPRLGW